MLVHDRSSKEKLLLMIMPINTPNSLSLDKSERLWPNRVGIVITGSSMFEPINSTTDIKERLISLTLDGLASPHTRRAYRAALDEFLTWSQGQQPPVLGKALVHRYKAMLIEKELAPATINQRLAAVRRVAQEAADNVSSMPASPLQS